MEQKKLFNTYQIVILIITIALALTFTVIYPITISRTGFEFNNVILVPRKENGVKTYSGKIHGEQAVFTLTEDKTLTFTCGEKTYGPYTLREDPTAIPSDLNNKEYATGIEIREGKEIYFRGAMLNFGQFQYLYNEDGSPESMEITVTMGDGKEYDEDGNLVDRLQPDAGTILELINGPELTHKGQWPMYFLGLVICIVNIFYLIFVDELYYIQMSRRMVNASEAIPSDWEIAGRYIGWTLIPILAFVVFMQGLQ